MEFGLLAAALVAVGCMRLVLALGEGRTNSKNEASRTWDGAIVAGLVGLGVGRIGAMISGGTNPFSHPADILIVRGGIDTVMAAIGALIAFAVVARHDLLATADVVAPAAIAGLAGWHAACFTRGACLGSTTDLPWAVAGPSGIGRHPVEIYAALVLAAGCGLLLLLEGRRRSPGVVAALGLAIAAGARLVTEPMRLTIGNNSIAWYGAGSAIGVAAAVAAWKLGRSRV